MFTIYREELDWAGRKLTLETGRVARQADGAVLATYGETTVLAAVVSQAATLTGLGIAAGLGASLILARFVTTLVFGVSVRDPLTFLLVPVVLALVAAISALVPARRAARVDPMDVLRD